jgi:hypothetical protein
MAIFGLCHRLCHCLVFVRVVLAGLSTIWAEKYGTGHVGASGLARLVALAEVSKRAFSLI